MKPVSRRELIRRLQALGFAGPYSGGKHEYMRHAEDGRRVTLPNPHGAELSGNLVAKILRDAGISRQEWDRSGE